MPKANRPEMKIQELRELAEKGAPIRLAELQGEIDLIYREFPKLRPRETRKYVSQPTSVLAAAETQLIKPKGRRMSSAERKAVSVRMTRYWANRRRSKK